MRVTKSNTRSGSCYLVRKGRDKTPVHPPDAIRVDGLPHEEVAKIFARCERFYCYDEATMFSQFAVLCGCLSIVIPGIYQSRADWVAARPIGMAAASTSRFTRSHSGAGFSLKS